MNRRRSSTTKNKRAKKLTKQITSIFCFLPVLQKPSSQSASSLNVNRRRRSSKHKQTREQRNSQNKSLPSSASYASKPSKADLICLSLHSDEQEKVFHNKKQESKQTHKTKHFHLLLPSRASKPSKPVKSQSISSFNEDRTASSKYIQTHTRKLTIIPYRRPTNHVTTISRSKDSMAHQPWDSTPDTRRQEQRNTNTSLVFS